MIKNDEKILELKNAIAKKKDELKLKNKKNEWLTNLVLEIDNSKHNLNVLSQNELMWLLIKINVLKNSATVLKINDKFLLSGYLLDEWMMDIQNKLNLLQIREEESKLKNMENKLTQLLSDEKKTEIELHEIESYLKD